MGAADTLRFVNQFTTGLGNYTAERDSLFGASSLDGILEELRSGELREDPPEA